MHPGEHCECVECLLRRILQVETKILHYLVRSKIISRLEITIMPKTILVGASALAHLVATGTDGKPFVLSAADTIALAAATPGDVSFGPPVFNADGSADVPVTGVNADPGDAITATVDGVPSNSDTLTVAPAVANVASVTLTLQ